MQSAVPPASRAAPAEPAKAPAATATMVLPDGVRLYVVTPVGHDAWLDNKIAAVYLWLFQDLFHNRARWTKCNGMME